MGKNLHTFNAFLEEANSDSPSITETMEKYVSNNFQYLDIDGNVGMDKESYIGFSIAFRPLFQTSRP